MPVSPSRCSNGTWSRTTRCKSKPRYSKTFFSRCLGSEGNAEIDIQRVRLPIWDLSRRQNPRPPRYIEGLNPIFNVQLPVGVLEVKVNGTLGNVHDLSGMTVRESLPDQF